MRFQKPTKQMGMEQVVNKTKKVARSSVQNEPTWQNRKVISLQPTKSGTRLEILDFRHCVDLGKGEEGCSPLAGRSVQG